MRTLRWVGALCALVLLSGCASGPTWSLLRGQTPQTLFEAGPQRQLAQAVCDGDARAVARLVAAGADPNGVGRQDQTPLAMGLGCTSVTGTRAILAAGADPDLAMREQIVPLRYAANIPNVAFLDALLDAGADPQARPNGATMMTSLLTMHDRTGNWRHLDRLLEGGLDVDAYLAPEYPGETAPTYLKVLVGQARCKALELVRQKPRRNELYLLFQAYTGYHPERSPNPCAHELVALLEERVGGVAAFEAYLERTGIADPRYWLREEGA